MEEDSDWEPKLEYDSDMGWEQTDRAKPSHPGTAEEVNQERGLPGAFDTSERVAEPSLDAFNQPAKPSNSGVPCGCFQVATKGRCDKGPICKKEHSPGAASAYCDYMFEAFCRSKFLNKTRASSIVQQCGLCGDSRQPAVAPGFRPKTPGAGSVKVTVLQNEPLTPATDVKAATKTFSALQRVFCQMLGDGLPPMQVEMTASVGDSQEVRTKDLLDSGANSSNYGDGR